MTSQPIEQEMFGILDEVELTLSNGTAAENPALNGLFDRVCDVLTKAKAAGYSSI